MSLKAVSLSEQIASHLAEREAVWARVAREVESGDVARRQHAAHLSTAEREPETM